MFEVKNGSKFKEYLRGNDCMILLSRDAGVQLTEGNDVQC